MSNIKAFSLRWNHHQQAIVSAFEALLENGAFSDCTLSAEGKTVNAHRFVLSTCSPYFEDLLSKNFEKHPIILMSKDIKFDDLRVLMHYMYKGEMNVNQDRIKGLIEAAKLLQIKGLSDSTDTKDENFNERTAQVDVSEMSSQLDTRNTEQDRRPLLCGDSLSESSSNIGKKTNTKIVKSPKEQETDEKIELHNDIVRPSRETKLEASISGWKLTSQVKSSTSKSLNLSLDSHNLKAERLSKRLKRSLTSLSAKSLQGSPAPKRRYSRHSDSGE